MEKSIKKNITEELNELKKNIVSDEEFKERLNKRVERQKTLKKEILEKHPNLTEEDITLGIIEAYGELGYIPSKKPEDYLDTIKADVVLVNGFIKDVYTPAVPMYMVPFGSSISHNFSGTSSVLEILIEPEDKEIPVEKIIFGGVVPVEKGDKIKVHIAKCEEYHKGLLDRVSKTTYYKKRGWKKEEYASKIEKIRNHEVVATYQRK
ncbi:MAG: hypothetical protein PHW96_01680 [Candidatus Nanoarchaeia archaeon]|nr:hypothetical protein [Candidatus Nanoarchaeia archaeon]